MNDLVSCPLCDGPSKVSREQLVRVLSDPALSSKVAKLVADLKSGSDLHPEAVPVAAGKSDFEIEVHNWNPANPMWKRSPKE